MARKTRSVTSKLITATLAAGVLILVAVVSLSYREWQQYGRENSNANRTRQILTTANGLLADIVDAETGQRGFVLTGETRYLDPYNHALQVIPYELTALNNLLSPQRQPVTQLNDLVAQKLAELRETIDLRRSQSLTPALEIVATGRGKELMDRIRTVIAQIEETEEIALIATGAQGEATARRALFVTIGGSLILLAFLIAGNIAIGRAVRAREAALTDAENARDSLRTTLASIGDAVISTDLDGRIVFSNKVAQSLLLMSETEVLGRRLDEVFRIVNEYNRNKVENPVTKVLREGVIVGLANHTVLIAQDGTETPIDDSGAPIRNSRGEMTGVVLVFRDITERRATEKIVERQTSELRESNASLAQANQDLERFAFAASHDLQEPLRMITAYSELLIESYPPALDGNAGMFVSHIVEGTQRMRKLLTDLLAYMNIGSGLGEPSTDVDLNLVLQQVSHNLKTSIGEADATVTSDPLPTIHGSVGDFASLLQNLVGNAIKYRSDVPPRIHVSVVETGGEFRFEVADNGIGIAPKYHGQVFEVFKRLHDRKIPGTGIGLAICKRVVERYGGRIWIDSREGDGATFCFTVPKAAVTAAQASDQILA